jgi:hypothetical protein
MDETPLFWKRMSERTFIHKEAKSMPGFKVCVSTLCDVRTTTKRLTTHFSERIPVVKRRMLFVVFFFLALQPIVGVFSQPSSGLY